MKEQTNQQNRSAEPINRNDPAIDPQCRGSLRRRNSRVRKSRRKVPIQRWIRKKFIPTTTMSSARALSRIRIGPKPGDDTDADIDTDGG